MLHLSHIEVADEFGGPGERPEMTALPDGFPSNSPVTQRKAISTSRWHVQVDNVDTSAARTKNYFTLLRFSDAALFAAAAKQSKVRGNAQSAKDLLMPSRQSRVRS